MINIALIRDNICENVVVFDDLNTAIEMLGDMYDIIIPCPHGRGMMHRYINSIWYNPQPQKDGLGVYQYVVDICVLVGDSVYGLDGRIYKALVSIDFQQDPPEDLPESYVIVM